MKKAIYKNPKSGKLYTFDKEEGALEGKIFPVFVNNEKAYDEAELKEDKKGKAYKVCEAEKTVLKNGFEAYIIK